MHEKVEIRSRRGHATDRFPPLLLRLNRKNRDHPIEFKGDVGTTSIAGTP